jgi:hypothetical protein
LKKPFNGQLKRAFDLKFKVRQFVSVGPQSLSSSIALIPLEERRLLMRRKGDSSGDSFGERGGEETLEEEDLEKEVVFRSLLKPNEDTSFRSILIWILR